MDTAHEKLTDLNLELYSSMLEIIANKIREGVAVTDTSGTIIWVNPAFTAITGYSSSEVLGHNPRILKSNYHDQSFYKNLWESILTVGFWESEIWNRRKSGEVYPEWISIYALKDNLGVTRFFVSIFTDLTEIKAKDQQMQSYIYTDALTGLANKNYFMKDLKSMTAEVINSKGYLGIFLIDLDRFKLINSTFGYVFGDHILRLVAKRLWLNERDKDGRPIVLYRLGEDEYAILAKASNPIEIRRLGKRIIEALQEPLASERGPIHVRASMGIAVVPIDGTEEGDLLRKAEIALNESKASGGNRFTFYDEDFEKSYKTRLRLENALLFAIEREEFRLAFQPQVDLTSGRIFGAEALLRWHHNGVNIPPAEFIPVAEEMGIIVNIGYWTLRKCCQTLSNWLQMGLKLEKISVNVSVSQCRDANFHENVLKIIAESQLDPQKVMLEITEGVLMEDKERMKDLFKRFNAAGIGIAIDDFGTGYSSLAYLKDFPIDVLKIDKSFIDNLESEERNQAIVRGIARLGEILDTAIIAEGVEKKEQLRILRDLGVRLIQGYIFSPPLFEEEFYELCTSHTLTLPL